MVAAVPVGRPQVGDQQVVAAEHVQGQEAVAVVVPVEEAVLLPAVDRVVGGVEVEDHLGRRGRVGGEELVDEHRRPGPAGPPARPVLQAAQGRGRGQGGVGGDLGVVGGGLPQRVVAQVLVVVQVLVPGGDGEDPLGQQGALRVGDELGVAGVGEGGAQGVDQAELAVGLAQEQGPGVGGDGAPGEVGRNRPPAGPGKGRGGCGTLCHRGGPRGGRRRVRLTPSSTNPWAIAQFNSPQNL